VGTGVGARGAEEVAKGTVLPSASATSVCFARFAAGPSPASTAPGAVPAAVVAAVGSPDETPAAVMPSSCLPLVDGVSNLIPGSAASGVLCSSSKMFTGHDSKMFTGHDSKMFTDHDSKIGSSFQSHTVYFTS